MERLLNIPYETSSKKRKRSINPSFLDKYGIAEVSGKGICVVCSIELPEESLKPYKLQRHMKTHANIAVNTATMDIDFHGALDLAEEKNDLLDYLKKLIGNRNPDSQS